MLEAIDQERRGYTMAVNVLVAPHLFGVGWPRRH